MRRWLIAACAAVAGVPVGLACGVPAIHNSDRFADSYFVSFLHDREPAVGAIAAMALATLPVVLLAAACARVGSTSRDRRLAAMRAAGASVREVRRVVVAETVVVATVGSVVGAGITLGLWGAATRQTRHGEPLIPRGVWPVPEHFILGMLVVPALAGLLAPWAARQLEVGLAGQSVASRRVHVTTPAVLIGLGIVSGLGAVIAVRGGTSWVIVGGILIVIAAMSLTLGLAGATPWVTRAMAQVLVRRDSAVCLLAGRGMREHPHLAGRAASGLVLVGLIGGCAAAYGGSMRQSLIDISDSGGTVGGGSAAYYLVPLTTAEALVVLAALLGALGIVVAVAENVVVRRVGLAHQVASGVPISVLRRVMVVEVAVPVAVLSLMSTVTGVLVTRATFGMDDHQQLFVDWWLLCVLVGVMTAGTALAAWVGSLGIRHARSPVGLRDRE